MKESAELPTAIDRLIELDAHESAMQQERLAHLSMMGAMIEALPHALIATDSGGKIILFNQQAEFMFGFHRSEVMGDQVERLMPERFRTSHQRVRDLYNQFEITRRSAMGAGMVLTGVRSDGREFPVEITLARMVVPTGILNLSLVRFSPRAVGHAAVAPASTKPEPVTGQEPEDLDANL
jgi:PAS domain S-box-containing protein